MKKIFSYLILSIIATLSFSQEYLTVDLNGKLSGSLPGNQTATIEFDLLTGQNIRLAYSTYTYRISVELYSPLNVLLSALTPGDETFDFLAEEDGKYQLRITSTSSTSSTFQVWLFELPFEENIEQVRFGTIKVDTLKAFQQNIIEIECEANSIYQYSYTLMPQYFSTKLIGPDNEVVKEFTTSGWTEEITIAGAGIYKLIFDSFSKNEWYYTIYINKIFPVYDADEITENGIVEGSLQREYDFNRYKILVQKDDTISFNLEYSNWSVTPKLEIIDPQGNRQTQTGTRGRELSYTLVATKSGYYGLNTGWTNQSFPITYTLNIQNNRLIKNIIQFDNWTDVTLNAGETYTGKVFIPEGEDMFLFMKKRDTYSLAYSWNSMLTLSSTENTIFTSDDNDLSNPDIRAQIEAPEAGLYTVEIDNYDVLNDRYAKILIADHPNEIELNEWSIGEILRPFGEDWKMVIVPENTTKLSIQTEGFGLYSTLDVYYENINQSENHWQFSNAGNGYRLNGVINNPVPGKYFLKYVDSAVLYEGGDNSDPYSQEREYMIYAGTEETIPDAPQPLYLESISTDRVARGEVTLHCEGTGFAETDVVTLINGDNKFEAEVYFIDSRNIFATFNLGSAQAGTYDIQITDAGGLASSELSDALTVEGYTFFWDRSTVLYDVDLELVYREQFRTGRFQPAVAKVTNNSGINLRSLVVVLTLPKDCVVEVENLHAIEYSEDDLLNPNEQEISIPHKNDPSFQDIPILIPALMPGQTKEITFRIKPITRADFYLDVKCLEPLSPWADVMAIGILPKSAYQTGNGDNVCDCSSACGTLAKGLFDNVISTALGFDDLQSCAYGIGDLIGNGINSIESGENAFWSDDYSFGQFIYGASNTTLSCLLALGKNIPAAKAVSLGLTLASELMNLGDYFECGNCLGNELASLLAEIFGVGSVTPEDKYGPRGCTVAVNDTFSVHYIDTIKIFNYKIDYWNKEDATAPAANVYIRDTLDANFDISTVNFTEIGFLKWKLPLEGGQYFNATIDCRPDLPYFVKAEGTVDPVSREIYWVHRTLDPETLETPDDPMAGYLPPIDSTGYQIGWVSFSVKPVQGISDTATFRNQAFVNFDGVGKWGPAPKEGPYTNIFDVAAPTSSMIPLPETCYADSILLEWEGEDIGCGVIGYTIYYSTDGINYDEWLTTDQQSAWLKGEEGGTYYFYALACDAVGNQEEGKSSFEASVFFELVNAVDRLLNRDTSVAFKVYPNPIKADQIIKIEFSLPDPILEQCKIEVLNASGLVVYKQSSLQHELIIPSLKQGLYLISLNLPDGEKAGKKILVE